ncbi:hypothetical protein CIB48_g3863 [Xylaria polymorpha]|nr:hypothetical protein CIB48_g3863 [Xylaria polymorpha]
MELLGLNRLVPGTQYRLRLRRLESNRISKVRTRNPVIVAVKIGVNLGVFKKDLESSSDTKLEVTVSLGEREETVALVLMAYSAPRGKTPKIMSIRLYDSRNPANTPIGAIISLSACKRISEAQHYPKISLQFTRHIELDPSY